MNGIAAPVNRIDSRPSARLTAWSIGTVMVWIAFAAVAVVNLLAPIQRTGDTHQYLAMAWSFATGHGPALSRTQMATWNDWLASQPVASGFPGAVPAMHQPALVRDGAQEFSHFWFVSLVAAPFVWLALLTGLHIGAGFLLLNLSLLAAVIVNARRCCHPAVALFLLASPIVWFVDKAQVEVFTWAMLSLAMIATTRGSFLVAALWIAVASTQNLPLAALVGVFWLAAIVQWRWIQERPGGTRRDRARAVLLLLATAAIALLHPLYYRWRLGVWTPQQLNGGIAAGWPDRARLFAVLFDPDIGIVPWVPLIAAVGLFGAVLVLRHGDRTLQLSAACAIISAGWLLFVFAQTSNLNSGGTPDPSRYGLWLLPLAIPFLETAARATWLAMPWFAGVLALNVMVMVCLANPAKPEHYVNATALSNMVNTWLPGFSFQPPEVFFERQRQMDGGAVGSAAGPDCHVILLNARNPDQPCPLSSAESDAASSLFQQDWSAVWIVRPGLPVITAPRVVGAFR